MIAEQMVTSNSGLCVAQSCTAIADTNDTTENILAEITIPPIAAGQSIMVTTLWRFTNSANSKTPRIRYGSTQGAKTGTIYQGLAATTSVTQRNQSEIYNVTTGSQIGFGSSTATGFGTTSGVNITSSVTTTGNTYIAITAQKDAGAVAASDEITLLAYRVEIKGQ